MNSDRLAKIISLVFSPVVTGSAGWAVVIVAYADSATDFAKLFGLLLLTTIGVPSLYIVQGVLRGKITDLHLKMRTQRFIPLVLAVVSSILLTILYGWLDAPQELVAMAATMAVTLALFTVITLYWKISFHVAVFTAGVCVMGELLSWDWLWGLVLLPAIIWARLKRRRHDIWQTSAAALVAAIAVLGTMEILL